MSDIAVSARGLGKLYRISARESYATLRDSIARIVKTPLRLLNGTSRQPALGRGEEPAADFIWAVKDASFDIKKGEVVGIIGSNGSGKSTLLKMISQITSPTEGEARIYGRIGSLLEVGTGFHPELTGRENVYLNGAILGMKKNEIERKFDEIAAFAEIEKFLGMPVKHYSSGMYMRLGFAVAAHLEPEILIVDEVLAVGDGAFQQKCLGKMSEVARDGRTVLFVSHNMQAISTLTRRALLLEAGRLVFDGDTPSALDHYRRLWNHSGADDFTAGEKSAGLLRAAVLTSEPNRIHRFGRPLRFEFELAFREHAGAKAFSFQIVDNQQRPVAHLWLDSSERRWARSGIVRLCCELPAPRVYMGRYTITTHLADRASLEHDETVEGICPFEVVMDGVRREYDWMPGACAYLEDAEWRVA
jgi:lipopolysaccharide transport system ATP-binding protein